MITLIKGKSDIPSNDLFFDFNIYGTELTQKELDIIAEIDHAEVFDNFSKISTPYGIGNLTDLSSGCKTAINILRFPEKRFSLNECGANAVHVILTYDQAVVKATFLTFVNLQKDEKFRYNDKVITVDNFSEFQHDFYKGC